jgi:hypothetical protein
MAVERGGDHHLDLIVVRCDCLVPGRTIISAIRCHLADRIVDLIEERADLGRIIRILIRQRLCHDHAVRRVHRQMQLAPRPARLRTMLRLKPLTRPIDLQTCAVDQYVQRTMRH